LGAAPIPDLCPGALARMPTDIVQQASKGDRFGREARVAAVCLAAIAVALAAWLVPPIAQPEGYHAFADQRSMLGIPNFLDVVSSLAFLIAGGSGLLWVARGTRADGSPAFLDSSERWGWGVAFAAVALTCVGSGYYHWAPDSPRLVWDRLPMAVGFMSMVAAITSERVNPKAGLRLLVPLVALGAASVWYWRWSAAAGAENLNPYGAVQFGSTLVIVLLVTLFQAPYTRSADLLGAAILYALAKVAEHFDGAIFSASGGLLSGHTLKHLLAAAAVFWLLRMLIRRRPISDAAGRSHASPQLRQ